VGKILIVDDEPGMRRILATSLSTDQHVISEVESVSEARSRISTGRYDAVITDQKMPDGQGLEVLAHSREVDPTLSVVFLTAFATVELAVESMRHGAFDFITKPFKRDVVRASARRACEHTSLLRENRLLKQEVIRLEGASEIIGVSRAMSDVRAMIARVAPTNATVLINGETGTGKELVAREIHRSSQRSAKPFVAVNCAAFTESLLESELYGHEKGSFTGADRSRPGLFEAAHEGTLFLDEIGELSPPAQAKLLRVLAEGEVLRIGATKAFKVDVRVLAATHRNLFDRVKEGLFREDLYYRLAVVPIPIPPLRDRREDIPALFDTFCRRASVELKVPPRAIQPAAMARLQSYAFPGNIRELRNLIERANILSTSLEFVPEDFLLPGTSTSEEPRAAWIQSLPEIVDLKTLLEDLEKDLMRRALESGRGIQAEAARRLQISRSDMGYRLAKYAIEPKGPTQV
jgi:DNA-binding NtrC family response regulator